MNASVPDTIAWPVITFMALVLVARFRYCRTNLYESYFSNLLGFLMLAQCLRERQVEVFVSRSGFITATTLQQLGFAAMIFACTEMVGFTMLWKRLSPADTRRSHRYYRLAAVILSAAFLIAATRARVAGQPLEVSGGWDGILAWGFYLAMVLILGARVVWMFAAELRKRIRSRELLLATGGLLLGLLTASVSTEAMVLAVTEQLGWTRTVKFRLWFHGFEFFYQAFFVFLLGSVPLMVRLFACLGLDRISRAWNSLQPLRTSMTRVVPESRFNIEHKDRRYQKTTLQLHQTVIEIRDAILQLRPYFRDVAAHELASFLKTYSVPIRAQRAATHAFQLAHAASAKSVGAEAESPDMALVVRSRSTTLDEEAADLLALAKWWARAAERVNLNATEAKVSASG